MQQLPQYNFDCQFRCGNDNPTVCKYQSLRLGHIVKTSHLFCNHSCPSQVYNEGKEDIPFLKKCFNRRYDTNFIDNVLLKHNTPTKLIVPDIWKGIESKIYNLLFKEIWFQDIGLTGSIIVDGVNNHKDIDIVLSINNIDDYIKWNKNNKLPDKINFIKTDYYIYVETVNQFFTSLWPNQKKVYLNKAFEKNITIPSDYTIEYNNPLNIEIFDINQQ